MNKDIDKFVLDDDAFLNNLKKGGVVEFGTSEEGLIVYYDIEEEEYKMIYKDYKYKTYKDNILEVYNQYKINKKPFEVIYVKIKNLENDIEMWHKFIILNEVDGEGCHGVILSTGVIVDISCDNCFKNL